MPCHATTHTDLLREKIAIFYVDSRINMNASAGMRGALRVLEAA